MRNYCCHTRTILFSMFFLLFSCSQQSEGMKSYFASPTFKNITVMLPAQNQAAPGDRFNPYVNALEGVDTEGEKLYGFLLGKGYLTFKENSVPFYRSNVPHVPFGSTILALPNYSAELEKHLLRDNGGTQCQIAERELQKITYKNTYSEGNWTVTACTFQYTVKPALPGLPVPTKVFEGKVKIGKNPDDGKWVVMERELGDQGAMEILPLLPQGKLKGYLEKKSSELNTSWREKRFADLKKAKEFTYIIGPEATFLGIVTSDDAIKIQLLQGQFNSIQLIFEGANGHRPADNLIGKRFNALGHGGEVVTFTSSGGEIFYDMLFHDQMEGLRNVNRFETAVNLSGTSDMRAKVTVYCIENSNSVNFEYWYGEKPFPNCERRLRSMDTSGFSINKYF